MKKCHFEDYSACDPKSCTHIHFYCICMTITIHVTLPVILDSTLTAHARKNVHASLNGDLKRFHTTVHVNESCTLLCVWLKVMCVIQKFSHYSKCDSLSCTLLCVCSTIYAHYTMCVIKILQMNKFLCVWTSNYSYIVHKGHNEVYSHHTIISVNSPLSIAASEQHFMLLHMYIVCEIPIAHGI